MENNKNLLNLLNEINDVKVDYKLICGDFNLPGIDWKFWTVKTGSDQFCYDFIEKIRDCYFYQEVCEITKFRGGATGNVLDLIFCNDEYLVENMEIDSPIGRSDHGCLYFTCDLRPRHGKQKNMVYMMEKANWSRLRELLDIDWRDYLNSDDVEIVWEKIKNKIMTAVETCVPKREFAKAGEKKRGS